MAGFKQGVDAQYDAPTVDKGPPADRTPSELVQRLIARGRVPTVTIDFPRDDRDTGEPIQKVMLRVLTLREETAALAAGRRHAASELRQRTSEEQPEDITHNACIAEILAMACRDPEDPAKTFFRYGADEIRDHLTAEETGALARAYARLRLDAGPRLEELSEENLERWIETVSEGVLRDPFSRWSHEKLGVLTEYCVMSLVALRRQVSGQAATPSSS